MKAPVNKIIPVSVVDGPGNRTAVFLQGCNISCAYCHNPETQNLCTGCGVCVDGCPAGLDIPMLLAAYNAFRLSASEAGRVEALPAEKQPSACVACGQCVKACPQGIDVPAHLKAFAAELARRSR